MALPQPVTLDFQRNYRFLWYMARIEENPFSGLKAFIREVAPGYISTLAKTVAAPEEAIDMDNIELGPLQTMIPKRFKTNPLYVTYLEDTGGSVMKFHRKWMDFMFNYGTLTDPKRAGGMTWEELGKVSLSAFFSNTVDFPIDTFYTNLPYALGIGELPASIEIFPRIIPISVKRGEYDKGGDGIQTVSVTYARLPRISLPRALSYEAYGVTSVKSALTQKIGGTTTDIKAAEGSSGGDSIYKRLSVNAKAQSLK